MPSTHVFEFPQYNESPLNNGSICNQNKSIVVAPMDYPPIYHHNLQQFRPVYPDQNPYLHHGQMLCHTSNASTSGMIAQDSTGSSTSFDLNQNKNFVQNGHHSYAQKSAANCKVSETIDSVVDNLRGKRSNGIGTSQPRPTLCQPPLTQQGNGNAKLIDEFNYQLQKNTPKNRFDKRPPHLTNLNTNIPPLPSSTAPFIHNGSVIYSKIIELKYFFRGTKFFGSSPIDSLPLTSCNISNDPTEVERKNKTSHPTAQGEQKPTSGSKNVYRFLCPYCQKPYAFKQYPFGL